MNDVRALGVIPARIGSTRLPGKPLIEIAGKPLLQWVVESAKAAKNLSEVLVATDDERIKSLAERLGVRGVMTPAELPSGSDRVWHAVQDLNFDVVINIQGDEPLITPELLDSLVEPFRRDRQLEMATLGTPIKEADLRATTTAKIVLNQRQEAIYFSRFPIPFSRAAFSAEGKACLKHIGIYAYRKQYLQDFCAHGPTALESAEGLEQLRALYLGFRIRVLEVEHASWGVDTPEDIGKVEHILKGLRHG